MYPLFPTDWLQFLFVCISLSFSPSPFVSPLSSDAARVSQETRVGRAELCRTSRAEAETAERCAVRPPRTHENCNSHVTGPDTFDSHSHLFSVGYKTCWKHSPGSQALPEQILNLFQYRWSVAMSKTTHFLQSRLDAEMSVAGICSIVDQVLRLPVSTNLHASRNIFLILKSQRNLHCWEATRHWKFLAISTTFLPNDRTKVIRTHAHGDSHTWGPGGTVHGAMCCFLLAYRSHQKGNDPSQLI